MAQSAPDLDLNETNNTAFVDNFCDITSSSREEALFFLESHQWDLDSALSTFFDNNTFTPAAAAVAEDDSSLPVNPTLPPPPSRAAANSLSDSPTESQSPNYSPSLSPSRSRSPSPTPSRAPYTLRSRGKKKAGASRTRGGIQTLADLNRDPDHGSGSDDDEDYKPPEYYTGGEKSGMLVQDPSKRYDGHSIFNEARDLAVERPADNLQPSSSFTGTGRLLTGEMVPAAPQPPPAFVTHTVTLWRDGFTLNDGPLRRFDDPANASFLESIKKTECPRELDPADRKTKVHLDLVRREENYSEPARPKVQSKPFQGVGRTLGSSDDINPASSSPAVPANSLTSAPLPSSGLVTDPSLPTTSIQLRLADGTRMVSRFNLHHAVRDIRAFIDASRPDGSRNYQLQTMGFPPKQLTDLDQTIEQAGIANSVVIQKI